MCVGHVCGDIWGERARRITEEEGTSENVNALEIEANINRLREPHSNNNTTTHYLFHALFGPASFDDVERVHTAALGVDVLGNG